MVAFDEVEADPREYRDTGEGYEGNLVATSQVKQVPCEYWTYHVAYCSEGRHDTTHLGEFFTSKEVSSESHQ